MTVYRTPHEKRPILNLATGFILALVFALLALLLGLPSILSTSWGQNQLIEQVNKRIPGKFAAATIRLSWLGPQEVENFALLDPQDNQVLRGDKVIANVPLWRALFSDVYEGKLNNLSGQLLVSAQGESNLQTALGLIPNMGSPITTIKLQNVNGSLEPGTGALLAGKTQVNKTPGDFALRMHENALSGHVDNFPVDLLQQFTGGNLKNILGETVDLEVRQNLDAQGRQIEGKIESPTLQASIKGEFDPKDTRKGQGNLVIHQFKLANLPEIEIKNIEAPWKLEGDELQFALQGSIGYGRLQGHGTVHNWETLKGEIDLAAVPIPFLEKLAGTEGLTNLLGPSIDLKGEIDSLSRVNLRVRGDQWNGNAAFINQSGWQLQEPASLKFTITPKRFNEIRARIKKDEEGKFSLQAPAELQVQIAQIGLPPHGRWTESYFDGTIAMDKLAIFDSKTEQLIQLKEIVGEVKSQNLRQEVQFNLQGKQLSEQGQPSNLQFKGSLKEGWLNNGNFNRERFSFNGTAQFQNLPAGMLCEVLCFEHVTRARMEAIFGETVSGTVQTQLQALQGPIHVSIAGHLGSIFLDGILNNQFLTLHSPFQLQLTPSPELGESILKDFLPILNGMVRGDQKISLSIDPQGFYLPLQNVNLENIQIGLLTLSLGRLEFQNEGQMGKIIGLIRPSNDSILPVWFTPIYVSAQSGVVQVQRFDMLALDQFPLALWGTIDLADDQINMVLGLSGAALHSAFKVPVPDSSYMMQFPLRGPIGSASIDKGRAATRLAALTAQAAGGPQGLVLGTVLGIASGAFADPKPPAPTTDPLPWANIYASDQTDESPAKKDKNPVKALEKGFKKLFSN